MRWLLLTPLVALALPGLGGAAQLKLGVRNGVTYDSNVRNSSTRVESGTDASGALLLDLNSERRDDLTWRLRYIPRFQKFFGSRSDLDNWRHQVQGNLQFGWTDATTLTSQVFYDLNERNLRTGNNTVTDPTLPVVDGNGSVERFQLNGGVSHLFTPRWTGNFAVNQSAVRFDQESASDADTTVVSSALNYALSRRQGVGGGISVTEQSTDSRTDTGNRVVIGDANGRPSVPTQGVSCDLTGVPPLPPGGAVIARVACTVTGQDTQFFQVFGRWNVALSPRWRFAMQAGPSHIRPSIGDASTTLFANLTLSRVARQSTWSAGFSRNESGAFGNASSTVANIFRTSWVWKPSEYWGLTLSGTYSLRESVQQNDKRKIDIYTASLSANRRLTRRLTAILNMTYRDQQNSGGRTNLNTINQPNQGFNSFETGIGVQYDFDPILF